MFLKVLIKRTLKYLDSKTNKCRLFLICSITNVSVLLQIKLINETSNINQFNLEWHNNTKSVEKKFGKISRVPVNPKKRRAKKRPKTDVFPLKKPSRNGLS